ncbi:MAG: CDP-diacylglycerol--glycerol-3-phosphate 3-phosphatidyltransferase [Bdellovibrionales bacterium]
MKLEHVPNLLTLTRILMIPAMIWLLLAPTKDSLFTVAILFIIASITDYLDGWVARRYDLVSTLGKFLDPISDKLLVSSLLIMLIPLEVVSPVLVILLISRDILIDGLRAVAASERIIISAGQLGKWKTAIQMFCIPAVLISDPKIFNFSVGELGILGLWFSVLLSILSGLEYTKLYLVKRKKAKT